MKRSQFGEDEHLIQIIAEIGEGSKVFCDIGARLDLSNAAYWLDERGWKGYLVDKDYIACNSLSDEFEDRAVVTCCAATIENINDLVPDNTRILSIDVDSVDWWLFANLRKRPAVVLIETNAVPGYYVCEYPLGDKRGGYGTSVEAVRALGEIKGYDYLGRTNVNAFFADKRCQVKYRLPPIVEHAATKRELPGNVMGGS